MLENLCTREGPWSPAASRGKVSGALFARLDEWQLRARPKASQMTISVILSKEASLKGNTIRIPRAVPCFVWHYRAAGLASSRMR